MAGTKSRKKADAPPDDAVPYICTVADEYLAAAELCRANEPIKEKRKKVLLEWIGDALTKTLPDGRIILRSSLAMPAESEPRKGYMRTTIQIVPKPAA